MPLSIIQYRVDARILRHYVPVNDLEITFSEIVLNNLPDELKNGDGELMNDEFDIASGASNETQVQTDGQMKLKDVTDTFGIDAIKYITVCKKKPKKPNNINIGDGETGHNALSVLMDSLCVPNKKMSR